MPETEVRGRDKRIITTNAAGATPKASTLLLLHVTGRNEDVTCCAPRARTYPFAALLTPGGKILGDRRMPHFFR
ncbi:MAG: hypothetical protein M3M89_06815 [Thermoproteota archaeon]|nr:hypothetical protein [Thermoproteota archaeon]